MIYLVFMGMFFYIGFLVGSRYNNGINYVKLNSEDSSFDAVFDHYIKTLKKDFNIKEIKNLKKYEKSAKLIIYTDKNYIHKRILANNLEDCEIFKENIIDYERYCVSFSEGTVKIHNKEAYIFSFKYPKETMSEIITKVKKTIADTNDNDYKYVLNEILNYLISYRLDYSRKDKLLDALDYSKNVLIGEEKEFVLNIEELLQLKEENI